jgi:hypothetical protein
VHLKRAFVAMVACALLVAACEKGLASESPGPTVVPSSLGDPCSMLTMAQVGATIDFTVNTQTVGDGGRTCTWTYADPNNMVAFNTARLTLVDPTTFAAMKAATDSATTITALPGLGDAAFYSATGQETSLTVEKGSRAFTVAVSGSAYTSAQSESDELLLAGFVLAGI